MLPMTTLLLLLLWPLSTPLGLASSSSSSSLEEEEAHPGLDLLPLREEEEEEEVGHGAGAFLMGPPQVPPPPPPPRFLLPRESRSPPLAPLLLPARRCVRVQESCMGRRLPCCDPCAACYCRLFQSNCFCRRFGTRAVGEASLPCGRD
ncbi:agouti-related protein [Anolis carolinensis]|uniref:agouti-related protein n=1 Tax=Anolis carolinensis TaxID=28377 RepID=UPI002F2B835E